jgi:hypothetical protein
MQLPTWMYVRGVSRTRKPYVVKVYVPPPLLIDKEGEICLTCDCEMFSLATDFKRHYVANLSVATVEIG